MQCAVKVAGLAGRLLGVCLCLSALSLGAQEQPTQEQPAQEQPAQEAPAEEAAPEEAAAEEAPMANAAEAGGEPVSVDQIVPPLRVSDAPSWAQSYAIFLDGDQNGILTAPELEAWKGRGEELMTLVEPSMQPGETFTGPVSIPEIVQGIGELQWQPNYVPQSDTLLAKAQSIIFRRNIWGFEFSFRPLRMIEVDIPAPNGRMERKLVWYIVYRVRYTGNDLQPEPRTDEFGNTSYPTTVATAVNSRRFYPQFTFESFEYDKAYRDQVIPAIRDVIAQRERPPAKLYNSVEMMNVRIPLSRPDSPGVWGYAAWTDIDPRIDYFSVFVSGLTNAFRYQDAEGFQPGDPPLTGRSFTTKTLRLNFWRPGDSIEPHEDEIRFGVPIDADPVRQSELLMEYGLTERLDYLWEYR